jgi:anti-anti-sigma factor
MTVRPGAATPAISGNRRSRTAKAETRNPDMMSIRHPTQSLKVFVAPLDTHRVSLTVTGDLDAFSVSHLDQRIVDLLNRSDTTVIELDLAGVEFVDAAAASQLRQLHQLAADSGCTVTISAATQFAWWLFASIGLTSIFPAPLKYRWASEPGS